MARETGLHQRPNSRYWWIDVVLPNGKRLRGSTKTENRQDAEALLAKLKHEAYSENYLGVKPKCSWKEAVVRYLALKANLRSIEDTRRICRKLDPYLGELGLDEINGDIVWRVIEGQLAKGNQPATVN